MTVRDVTRSELDERPGIPVERTKVVHLITGLNSGGAEMMLYKLMSSFDRTRFEMQVISMTDGGLFAPRIVELGVPLTSLGMQRGSASALAMFRLVRLLRRARPDVLQTWMYHADLMGLVAGRAARVRRLVWNVRASDLDFADVHRSLRKVYSLHALFSGMPDAVIVNSVSGMQFHHARKHDKARWELIHNGFDLHKFRPDLEARARVRQQLGATDAAVVIGMIARFDGQKDHETFFRAAQSLATTEPDVVFVLAGKGVEPSNVKIKDIVERLALTEKVRLLGECRDTSELLPALDIVTLSSRNGEGLPNALGEAMSCGIPCVATDVGDSALLLADTGKVVAPGDASAIARCWRELIAMGPVARQRLGGAARRRIAQDFDIGGVVRRYERLYEVLRGV